MPSDGKIRKAEVHKHFVGSLVNPAWGILTKPFVSVDVVNLRRLNSIGVHAYVHVQRRIETNGRHPTLRTHERLAIMKGNRKQWTTRNDARVISTLRVNEQKHKSSQKAIFSKFTFLSPFPVISQLRSKASKGRVCLKEAGKEGRPKRALFPIRSPKWFRRWAGAPPNLGSH